MITYNKIIIVGVAGTLPELKQNYQGDCVTSFKLATNHTKFNGNNEYEEETEWFSIIAWNELAQNTVKYVQRGKSVLVEGRLKTRNFHDSEDQMAFVNEIIADKVLAIA